MIQRSIKLKLLEIKTLVIFNELSGFLIQMYRSNVIAVNVPIDAKPMTPPPKPKTSQPLNKQKY